MRRLGLGTCFADAGLEICRGDFHEEKRMPGNDFGWWPGK